MKIFNAEEMRSLDRRAIEEAGIPGSVLMERAGIGFVRVLLDFAKQMESPDFLILAGKGNNGGDALVAARELFGKHPMRLVMTGRPEELSGDAALMYHRLPDSLKRTIRFSLFPEDFNERTIVVDGLLGTGFRGKLKAPLKQWIAWVNQSKCPVVSIDIPSGLNADDGNGEDAVVADLTVTMVAPKTGMLSEEGIRKTGRIRIVDIRIPEAYVNEANDSAEGFSGQDARKLLSREPFDSFKNRRGHLCVIGGSREYPGAPCLSAEAALRTGCGLVTLHIPENAEVFCSVPKAVIVRRFSPELIVKNWQGVLSGGTAVAIGPGLTTSEANLPLLAYLLTSDRRLVLDADALNLLAKHPELRIPEKNDWILTPHPGEMIRLMNGFSLPVSSREENAKKLAKRLGATVLLKGARTLVATPDGRLSCNLSGCPALSTAGSGDVLTGICGAFLSMGFSSFDSARLGAYVHGIAGETACPCGSHGMIADDLPPLLPVVLRKILPVF